ncbi:hypothetical protein [Treponema bryantii]|nr:hypothetical protein [Treponema bryantii]
MKIKSFFIFCCFSMFLIGCNSKEIDEIKKKNELLEKENNDLNTQISDLSNSIRELKKTNYELNHQHEDSEQYMFSDFELTTLIDSIFKDFHYEFPEIINFDNIRTYTYDTSKFSKEEKQFYNDYVGCYLPEIFLTKEYISSHLSEFTINFIENDIVFWGYRRSKNGIHYDIENKKFYTYTTFSSKQIENFSEYKSFQTNGSEKYIRLTDFNLIKEVIDEKKQKMNREPLSNLEENKVRELLLQFYSLLQQNKFNKILNNYFSSVDKNYISHFEWDEYVNMFYINYGYLYDHVDPFDIYINTFFNDNIDNYDEDIIFVELKYSDPTKYVSFAIKEIDGKYKIIKYNL